MSRSVATILCNELRTVSLSEDGNVFIINYSFYNGNLVQEIEEIWYTNNSKSKAKSARYIYQD